MVRAFIVYVRPLLEFASCVWSPHLLKDINRIESVQRRFTKRLPGMADISYSERLDSLGMETLELRRLQHDLLLTYKMLFGLLRVDSSAMFTLRSDPRTRGHQWKLYQSHNRLDRRKYFSVNELSHRGIVCTSHQIVSVLLTVLKASLNLQTCLVFYI